MSTNLVYEPDTDKRPGFSITAELRDKILRAGSPINMAQTWNFWADVTRELGQECARRSWVYPGAADQDEPPPGGTPVAIRMAA